MVSQALHLGLRVNMMHLVQGMDATVSLLDLVVFLLYPLFLFLFEKITYDAQIWHG